MDKYPYIQWFVGDWLSDPSVRMLSPAARGIWFDWLCAMHELDRCGQISGTTQQLARIGYCTLDQVVDTLAEIKSTRAAECSDDGHGVVTVTNRRMRREYERRASACKRKRCERHKLVVKDDNGDGHNNVTDVSRDRSQKSEVRNQKSEEEKERALFRLIDWWNDLPEGVRSVRHSRSKAISKGFDRTEREPELRDCFADLDALREAIVASEFCHSKGWFTLDWLFSRGKEGEWNARKILQGRYRATPQAQKKVRQCQLPEDG